LHDVFRHCVGVRPGDRLAGSAILVLSLRGGAVHERFGG
jgi:hypothetical protein